MAHERSETFEPDSTGGAAPPLPSAAEVQALFDGLEVLDVLGRGGMGVVYRARQKKLDRLVALKILAPWLPEDPAFEQRFTREARALAKLNHPNIVGVYDFGEAGGRYYLIMEFVEGTSLREVLQGDALTPAEALAIVPQVCEGLQFAHEHGIVHRDIKPENILLDRSGRVKIADFGLAKLVGADAKSWTLTMSDQALGTPQYMAPEQIRRPLEVDHRADIYSLGVVLYEMLTRELPVGRFPMPSQKCGVDARLDAVVAKALDAEPARRYQQVSDVRTAVEDVRDHAGTAGRTSSAGEGDPFAGLAWADRLPIGRLDLAMLCVLLGVAITGTLSGAGLAASDLNVAGYPLTFLGLLLAMTARVPQAKRDLRLGVLVLAVAGATFVTACGGGLLAYGRTPYAESIAALLAVGGHVLIDAWFRTARPGNVLGAFALYVFAASAHAARAASPGRSLEEGMYYFTGMLALHCGTSVLVAIPSDFGPHAPPQTVHAGMARAVGIGLPAAVCYFGHVFG